MHTVGAIQNPKKEATLILLTHNMGSLTFQALHGKVSEINYLYGPKPPL